MPNLITHREATLQPASSAEYRDEITFSSTDAARYGIRHGEYGILKTTNVIPDVPGHEHVVRLLIGNIGEARSNTLMVNSLLFEELQSGLGQEWELRRVDRYQPIQAITLEPSVEQERLRDDLNRLRRNAFINRSVLVAPGQAIADLSLRVTEQAYFNVRDLAPSITGLREPTVFGIEERTEINLFVPHRKGGIDMVIVVDASNSMDLPDYVDRRGTQSTRMQAASRALDTLLQRRLYSGSRVSRFALVAFGRGARMIYPSDTAAMVELTPDDVRAMQAIIPYLIRKVDREGSNVAEALDVAADLLFKNAREDNEKIIVLLSDGAHWVERKDAGFQIEFGVAHEDAVMFADNLYDQGQIRIHTVAISNEENVRQHARARYQEDMQRREGERVWIPNPKMLSEIARRTRAKFFPGPDAEVLNKLLDDLGEGALFPVL